MTSLNSGLPSRETCFHGPWPLYLPVRESQTFDYCIKGNTLVMKPLTGELHAFVNFLVFTR